jgi:arylsulfatase A-like enzyme
MQNGVIDPQSPWGLPLDEKLFPEYLQANGYDTHMVRKEVL